MITTRSAFDLSYIFLVFYTIGLVFTGVYLVYEQAVVGWVCIVVEIAFAIVMLGLKIYLDHWGPYSKRSRNRQPDPSLSISSRARLELHKFLGGQGGAPFPLLQAEKAHAAAHLLLDCRLEGKLSAPDREWSVHRGLRKIVAPGDTAAVAAVEAGSGAPNGGTHAVAQPAAPSLSAMADLLEIALEEAGVHVQRRQTVSFPSFRRGPSAAAEEDSNNEPSMVFIPCKDGYVTAMWFGGHQALAVDFVGAGHEVIASMNTAASAFCQQLTAAHPNATIAASAVSRLPLEPPNKEGSVRAGRRRSGSYRDGR